MGFSKESADKPSRSETTNAVIQTTAAESDAAVVYELAGKNYHSHDYKKASDLYEQYLRMRSGEIESHRDEYARIYLRLGICRYHNQDLPKAIEALTKSAELNPSDVNTYEWLGSTRYYKKDYELAASAFQNAIQRTAVGYMESHRDQYARIYLRLGICRYYTRDLPKALEALIKASEFDPSGGDIYEWLGTTHYARKEYESAAAAYQEAIERTASGEKKSQPDEYARIYFFLGLCRYYTHDLPKALEALTKSAELNPADADVYEWLGSTHYERKEYELAATAFQNSIQRAPDRYYSQFWLGESLSASRSFKAAAAAFERAKEIKPDARGVQFELLQCYLLSGQLSKAYTLNHGLFGILTGTVWVSYLIGIALLLRKSFIRTTVAEPKFSFSLSWIVVTFEGQFAFVLLYGVAVILLGKVDLGVFLLAGVIAANAMVWIAVPGFQRQCWGAAFRWPETRFTAKTLLLAVSCYAGLMLMSIAYPHLYRWLTNHAIPPQPVLPIISDAWRSSRLLTLSAVVLFAPISEEILFRGLLYVSLENRWGRSVAIFATSLLFAAVHFSITYFLPLLAVGLVLGVLRARTGSIALPIIVHVLNNAAGLLSAH
jgi:tetratricopeptide (TPR) repeat protein